MELNRAELIQQRVEVLEAMQHLADAYFAEPDPSKQSVLLSELLRFAHPASEYSAMARAFLNARGLPSQ